MKVLIMAGGTGGHIMPGLALARSFAELGAEVHWLGTPQSMEARLVPQAGLPFHAIPVRGVRGKGVLARLTMPWMLLRGVVSALAVLRQLRPQLVLGFGGYVAAPGGLAAAVLRIPLAIHEQNARAGSTNRLLARFAQRVLSAYADAFGPGRKVEVVGNPVRAEILALPPRTQPPAHPLRLLVLGGSQGARVLNRMLPAALALLPVEQRPQVRHQAGRTLDEAVEAYARAGLSIQPEAFIEDMPAAYAAADVVLCRAGALSLAEIMAVGLPAICVPLPTAIDDHQTANARHLVEAGGGWLLPEAELNPQTLADLLASITQEPEQLLPMREAARAAASPEATLRIREHCLRLVPQGLKEAA